MNFYVETILVVVGNHLLSEYKQLETKMHMVYTLGARDKQTRIIFHLLNRSVYILSQYLGILSKVMRTSLYIQ